MTLHIYDTADPARSECWSAEADGRTLPVHFARVSAVPFNRRWPGHQRTLDQTEEAAFIRFAADGPVELRLTPHRRFREIVVRPLSRTVVPVVAGDSARVVLPAPGGYTVETDDGHQALHVFFDPLPDYHVKPDDPDTLYFGPGQHDVGMVHLKTGQTVYLDEAAVVYGCFHAKDADRIRILGRGILDNSRHREVILFEVDQPDADGHAVKNFVRPHTVQFERGHDIRVEGITIRDSLCYNIAAYDCEELHVESVKIIGCWRYNTDGINLHNCRHCSIRHCFLRTYDDAICVKGHEGCTPDAGHIRVEGCTIWCDWGRGLEIGAETRAERIHDVLFRDCDLIRSAHIALDVQNVHYAEVHDIVFENIRVEYDPRAPQPTMQRDDAATYQDPSDGAYMPVLFTAVVYAHPEYSRGCERRGRNRDITVRDIRIYADRMPATRIGGCDEQHQCSNIRFENIRLNDRRMTTLEEARIRVERFANGVTIE